MEQGSHVVWADGRAPSAILFAKKAPKKRGPRERVLSLHAYRAKMSGENHESAPSARSRRPSTTAWRYARTLSMQHGVGDAAREHHGRKLRLLVRCTDSHGEWRTQISVSARSLKTEISARPICHWCAHICRRFRPAPPIRSASASARAAARRLPAVVRIQTVLSWRFAGKIR